MKENLLILLFIGILMALAYHQAMDLAYEHLFPTSRFYQDYWYVPLLLVPGSLLAALAWALGFFRRAGWADAAALAVVVAIAVLTLEAPYSCWMGCF